MDAARSDAAVRGDTPKVLHVSECSEGGVGTAVMAYIQATPRYAHWLLSSARPSTERDHANLIRGWFQLPVGHLAGIRAVGQVYDMLRPDVVHAHSSFAGVYVRTCMSVPTNRIVYTPHCYAFERIDVSRAMRRLFRGVETVLAHRTHTVVAVSSREASLALSLRPAQRVVHVPNAVPASLIVPPPRTTVEGPVNAVAVGRLCAQKDPGFLTSAARIGGNSIHWTWIGGGDARLRRELESAGVRVTGWLPRTDVLQRLRSSDAYVHTARWEGAPMSLLEAVASGLPVVARDIPSLRMLNVPDLVRTPRDLADAVGKLADPIQWNEAVLRVRTAMSDHTMENLADRLPYAYGWADFDADERRGRWLATSESH